VLEKNNKLGSKQTKKKKRRDKEDGGLIDQNKGKRTLAIEDPFEMSPSWDAQ
jgi:hypothetical protein